MKTDSWREEVAGIRSARQGWADWWRLGVAWPALLGRLENVSEKVLPKEPWKDEVGLECSSPSPGHCRLSKIIGKVWLDKALKKPFPELLQLVNHLLMRRACKTAALILSSAWWKASKNLSFWSGCWDKMTLSAHYKHTPSPQVYSCLCTLAKVQRPRVRCCTYRWPTNTSLLPCNMGSKWWTYNTLLLLL